MPEDKKTCGQCAHPAPSGVRNMTGWLHCPHAAAAKSLHKESVYLSPIRDACGHFKPLPGEGKAGSIYSGEKR